MQPLRRVRSLCALLTLSVGPGCVLAQYGNAAWLDRLSWSGSSGYRSAANVTWRVDGDRHDAGTSKTFGGLTFVRVKDAGHMVPMDQPRVALDLLERFLDDRPFDTRRQQEKD